MRLPTINLHDPAIQLGFFGMVGIGVVSLFHFLTFDTIKENERNVTAHLLQAVLSGSKYDNDVATDITIFQDIRLNQGKPFTVYRARRADQPAAVVFSLVTQNGYNGDIRLLLALSMDGVIQGVRVIEHKETPGLGDKIEFEKSRWIRVFTNHSLTNPASSGWAVTRDGGYFDQIAGATVTSRAIVNIINIALKVFDDKHDLMFGTTYLGAPGTTDAIVK